MYDVNVVEHEDGWFLKLLNKMDIDTIIRDLKVVSRN